MTIDQTTVDRRLFSQVSALAPVSPGVFDVDLDPNWTIGGKPNGGYLLAMLGRAAVHIGHHDDVLAASAHYLRSPDPAAAVIEVELLRAGRTASQIRGRLTQNGRTCVEALVTTGSLGLEDKPFWQEGLPLPGTRCHDECEPLVPRLPDGSPVSLMEQIQVRLDPDSTGFTRNAPSGRGQLRGWLELPEGEPFDPVSLLFAVDAFPPATFDIELSGWVPTLELSAYVRARPAPGPIQVLQRAQLIQGQKVDEACFLWDHAGRLVAQATQLAGVRLG